MSDSRLPRGPSFKEMAIAAETKDITSVNQSCYHGDAANIDTALIRMQS